VKLSKTRDNIKKGKKKYPAHSMGNSAFKVLQKSVKASRKPAKTTKAKATKVTKSKSVEKKKTTKRTVKKAVARKKPVKRGRGRV